MPDYQTLIGASELAQHLDEPSWRVVDCRFDLMEPAKGLVEYRRHHIPGAQYADLDRDLAGRVTGSTGRHPLPSPAVFADTLGGWGIGNDSQVVVYDHAGGAIAARLWWMLNWVGHERVAVLDGGYRAWREAGYTLSDGDENVDRSDFAPDPDAGLVISTDELESLLATGQAPSIVDARDSARYAGDREPLDRVAGHIPGAVNHPFSESLQPDGAWKGRDELKARWGRVLGDQLSWISMCGSGVTACHLVLSARLAGIPAPRLYVGSWSEWIRDPGRPVATGPGRPR
ncbi:MAG: sulfurtransferase [Woeseia sp.]